MIIPCPVCKGVRVITFDDIETLQERVAAMECEIAQLRAQVTTQTVSESVVTRDTSTETTSDVGQAVIGTPKIYNPFGG